ncbi:MAG TPA: glutamate-1-semialdehyde 2,1-aminomutase [Candidatus Polarisedimenticolia bacterium]|nr:glutamate-1-semialdehyde 2,1-aminomutase [Candidatus Polarisedimenticolia bacterium]
MTSRPPGAPTAARPRTRSRELLEKARCLMPGGVNSPVRAFSAVGGDPIVMARGQGARVFDVDGNQYIDYLGSWGPLILGHAPAAVVAALRKVAEEGTSFGAPTPREAELAAMVVEACPWIEMVRMVNSGTEATLSALRLARGATGRDLIVKIEGCYHGHVDALLVKAGSGVLTLGIPGSPGVPRAVAEQTLTVPFNDAGAMEQVFSRHPDDVACVILEPVAGNMGVVPPADGYLRAVREITRRHGALLIMDEVMTGFRVGPAGAQGRYGVTGDLTTLGKVIGGGLPVGAYGGDAGLMRRVSPSGPIYQAGTLSGNPLAMAAGIETLRATRAPGFYDRLERLSARLEAGLAAAAREQGAEVAINRVGSMMCAFFTAGPVTDFASASRSDTARYARFFNAMTQSGVNLAPSQFEALFVSAAHSEGDIDETVAAARGALAGL